MSTPQKHRARGAATYRGDVTGIVGEVKGPTTYGSYLVADTAVYDRDTDSTRVTFRHATTHDMAAS